MSFIRESELPGIGKKFLIQTRSGDKLVVIIHNDGRREMYHFNDDDPEETVSQISLDDDEARQIASIVGGMVYKPQALESIEVSVEDLIIEWIRVEAHYDGAGKSIAELEIRKRTGASILAIVGRQNRVINPGPEHIFAVGATIVLAGERQQIRNFKELLIGKPSKATED
ncbi:cation:proton antiporter regulatory subunit [Paenibacillus cisolokensis]|uniref:cation:proton antiporter regulatory subunit n=1 Tax=Paenibacillus cisolokensis TaxID=1658519 RepID=UPI003D2A6AE1